MMSPPSSTPGVDNPFKAALKAGQPQIGLWQSLASPYTAEICAGAGFDWLLFDGEHGPNDVPSMLAQLQAVEAYPVHAIARPPAGETRLIKQYLDIGFTTLLIPMVETADQARDLVRAVRYPPDGVRGVAPGVVRAARWGRHENYLSWADAQVCLLVQVETKLGLENLDAIAAVEGVDGVFIGPADLSASLGHRERPAGPEMLAVIEAAGARIQAASKAAGVIMSDEALARRFLATGFSFLAVGSDIDLLVAHSSALATRFKGEAAVARQTPRID
jgi:4-hydroxy-2-oxoheptanedioate aldolase